MPSASAPVSKGDVFIWVAWLRWENSHAFPWLFSRLKSRITQQIIQNDGILTLCFKKPLAHCEITIKEEEEEEKNLDGDCIGRLIASFGTPKEWI